MKVKFVFIFISLSITLSLSAQQIITAAGDAPKTSTSSLQWTVGQIVTGSETDGTTYLFQGYQQSTIIVSDIYENDSLDYALKVYPNPVNSLLTIEVGKQGQFVLVAKLFSVSGKEYSHFEIKDHKHIIDLYEFSSGTYILILSENNNIVRTYKIIKQ